MVAMPSYPKTVDVSLECNLAEANGPKGCSRSFVVSSRSAAGLVKGDSINALQLERGDHTLCERAIRATWGVQLLKKQTLGL